MKTIPLSLICISTLITLVASARTWTDTQNRTMEAELVRVEGDKAVFRKTNGMKYRFTIADLSDADQKYINTQYPNKTSNNNCESEKTAQLPESELCQWLDKRLVIRDRKRIKRARRDDTALPQAEYIAFYYSASWCPPCRKFTPQLVEFYNAHREANPNFEIVFVSSDRDENSQENYIIEDEMPWPAVEFDDARDETIRKYAGSSIPCLVLVNREGKVLEDTYVKGQYMGPTRVMEKLGKLLNK